MQEILEQLNRVRGVGGSMLISGDGLPMASALRAGTDENDLGAALSGLIDKSQGMCKHLELGTCRSVQGFGGDGGVLLFAAGPGFLAVLVDPAANLALLQLEAKPFAEKIAQKLAL
jgi:uncharacterized protein